MGSARSGGLKGLNEMKHKPLRQFPSFEEWNQGKKFGYNESPKEFKDEKNWLDDELDIQKTKEFDWKHVIFGELVKYAWVAGFGYFMYKLINI